MANDNKDIELKIKVDTSDVEKSMKDVSKASDKMAKDVSSDAKQMSKDTDKINKVFKDLQKTLKNSSKEMQNAFKNINTNGFNKTLNDMKNTATKTASTIKQQLQDAFNVKGNVKVSTTTDKSNGASSGNGMASSLAGSAMSGGAIGSQIAKELAQGMKEGVKQAQENFRAGLSGIKSEAETLNMVFDGIDDNLIEQMNNIKAEIEPMMQLINNAMAEMMETNEEFEPFDTNDFSKNLLVAKSYMEDLEAEFEGLDQGLQLSEKGLIYFKTNLHTTAGTIDDLCFGLSDAAKELDKLTRPGRGINVPLKPEEIEHARELLQQMNSEINNLQANVNKINFIDNFDTTQLISSLEKFQQAQTKANAQPLINELQKIQQEANRVGISIKGVDDILQQYSQIDANATKLTAEFRQALIGVGQQFKEYNAQVQVNAQAQALMKQRQAELRQQTTTLGQVLVKSKHHLQDFGTALKQAFSSGMQKAGQYIDNLRTKSKQMADSHKQAAAKIKSANAGIMASFKGLLTSMMPFLTLYGAFNLLKTSVTEAMGAIESNNMYMAVFGDKANEMNKWIQSVNQSMGLGVNNTKQYTAIIQQMGSAMGLTSDEAMNMSQKMATMAGDISSFYNVDIAQAQNDLRSALSGSNEVLTKYGIVLREDTIKQYAYANGLAVMGSELTAAQRAMTLTMMVEQQLGQANGDMARTLDSPANRARRLSTAMYDLRVALGNVVLPIWNAVMPGLIALANALTAVFNKIAGVINGILSLFGLGLKGGSSGGGGFLGDVADSVGGIGSSLGDGLSDASGGASKVADSLGKGAENAKKIAKSLMGIDQINNLSSSDSSGGSGSGGSGGSGGGAGGGLGSGLGDLGLSDKVETQIVETGDGIPKWLQRIADIFKNAFNRSFNYDMFKDFLKNCGRVKQALLDIFSNEELKVAMNALNMTTIAELGSWVGTIGTLFFSIGNAIVGGLANSLEKNKQYIIDKLIGIANIEREASVMRQRLSEALSEIFSALGGEEAQTIVENIFDTLIVGFLEGRELFAKLGRDMTLIFAQSIIDNKDKIIEAWTNNLSYIADITGSISTFFQDAFKKVNEVYDQHIKPFIDSFSQGLSDLYGALLDGYNTYFKPAMDSIAQKFEEVLNGSVGECVSNFLDLIGDIFDCLTVLWNDYLQPILDWVIGVLAPLFAGAWDIICTAVLNAIDVIAQVINGIIEIFRGIVQFLTGIFTGDWQKAWDGLCLIFEGFKDIIMAIWDNLVNNTKEIVDKLKAWLIKAWEAIKDKTIELVKILWSKVVERWRKLGSDISTLLQNISSTCKTKFEEIKQKVIDKVKELCGKVVEWFKSIYDGVTGKCSEILTSVKAKWEEIKTAVVNKIIQLKTDATNKITEIKTNIVNKFNEITQPVKDVFEGVKSTISGAIEKVKGMMNFSWSLPKPKIPKFSISGGQAPWGFGGQGKLPSISIRWNKDGGIFTSPTIFGTNKGFQGVGEAGAEAILPLERLWSELGKQFDKQNRTLSKGNNQQPIQVQVVLDGKVVAQSTIKEFKDQSRRGVLDTSWL